MCRQLLSTVLIISLALSRTASEEGDLYIDSGVCPGERCTYRELIVSTKVYDVYEKPSTSSRIIDEIDVDEVFITKAGEVHTAPKNATVVRP
jgi:hypothetical protein